METNNYESYESYKRRSAYVQKRKDDLFKGKASILVGIGLLLYVLFTLPFHADNPSAMRGDELEAGEAYYIENLQLLDARVEEADEPIYCVAKLLDRDQNEWIISFNPRTDEHLVERIKLSMRLGKELDLVTSGYIYLDEIPEKARIYYSSHSDQYADLDGGNVLKLHADYLCGASGNYTLQALLRPGYTRAAFVAGVVGVIFGGVLLFKNRTRRLKYA